MKVHPVTHHANMPRMLGLCVMIAALAFVLGSSAIRSALSTAIYPQGAVQGGPTVAEQFIELPLLSLADAQKQTSFAIPVPTWLPHGFVLRGAFAHTNWVSLSYSGTQPASGIGVEVSRGAGAGNYVYPASARQTVSVNGHPATLIQGSWNQAMEWDTHADAGALTWDQGGFTYRLGYSGVELSPADLIKMAESLR